MYRRYYQGYNGFNGEPQRPIGEETNNSNASSENSTGRNSEKQQRTAQKPEIIIPEKPSQNQESHSTLTETDYAGSKLSEASANLINFFRRFKRDDFLILALILLFLLEGRKNEGIVVVLIFLFFVGL